MHRLLLLLLILVICFSFSSCRIFYPNVMFKTEDNYPYVDFDSIPAQEYKILAGDMVTMQVFTNLGYGQQVQVVVPSTYSSNSGGSNQVSQIGYLVQQNGTANLPVVGAFQLAGMSIPEAQEALKQELEVIYKNPMVIMSVINRRAYVFTAGSEAATVVTLERENMNLVEVLASAGGIPPDGKAYKIKLIRGDLNEPMIDIIDLSTVEGMKKAELTVLPDDIIYVEPQMKVTTGLLGELSPVLGLLGSITSIFSIFLLLTRENGN